jgi:acyl-CoA thioester hydrolase
MSDTWKFEHELEVRFRDCDPMGHVNNAVYLTYLEAARFAWWRRAFGPSGLKEQGFIVARVEIDYRKPALPGERLLIRLRVDGIGRSSFTVGYEVLSTRTREVVAEAKSVQVAFDYVGGASVPLSEDLRAKLEMAY